MDGLLRRHLPANARPGDDCLDAETLAAWADDGLDEATRTLAEAHTAGCGRCQALMAAVIRSEPPPRTAAPWWSRLGVRWLVPIAGAAAATLVWMVGPSTGPDRPAVTPELTQARAEAPALPATADDPPAPERRDQAAAEEKAEPAAKAKTETRDEQRANSPAAPLAGGQPSEASGDADARQRLAKQTADARPAAENAAEPVDARKDLGRLEGRSAALLEAPPQPAAAAPPPAPPPSPPAPSSVVGGRLAGSEREAFADRIAPAIRSGDPAVQWRLAAGGAVERSTDGGATWARLDTGTSAVLTAGHAPSALVCWLVGRDGVVLLSTDARTWRRAASPSRDDLVSVDAADARTAVIATARGESYRTLDGGVTWAAVP
jgi:hypothetical protein